MIFSKLKELCPNCRDEQIFPICSSGCYLSAMSQNRGHEMAFQLLEELLICEKAQANKIIINLWKIAFDNLDFSVSNLTQTRSKEYLQQLSNTILIFLYKFELEHLLKMCC